MPINLVFELLHSTKLRNKCSTQITIYFFDFYRSKQIRKYVSTYFGTGTFLLQARGRSCRGQLSRLNSILKNPNFGLKPEIYI